MKTYGYDYAFAVPIHVVNEIWRKRLAGVDVSLDFSYTDSETGTSVSGQASLGPWALVPGGQNSLVRIDIPLVSGTLSFLGEHDLAGVVVRIEACLGWLGTQAGPAATGGGDADRLGFTVTGTGDTERPGHVRALGVPVTGTLDEIGQAALMEATVDALARGKEQIEYILAGVVPRPHGVASWLSPKRWRYVYSQTGGGQGALCVLTVLDDRELPDPAFDASTLMADRIVLLVSQSAFFTNVLLPATRKAFPAGTFSVSGPGDACLLANSTPFDFGKTTADSYTVTQGELANTLALRARGGGPLKFLFGLVDLPGASYSWDFSATPTLDYHDGTASFTRDPNPTGHQDTTIYWYDWLILAGTGIFGMAGLASLVYDTVTGFGNQANESGIDDINTALQNSTGGAVANLSNLVDWHWGGRALLQCSAGLDGAFYVFGILGPDSGT